MERFAMSTMLVIVVAFAARAQSSPAAGPVSSYAPAAADVAPATKLQPPASFGGDGLLFSTADGSSRLRVNGYLQGDGRFFSTNLQDQSPDQLLWRRIRPNFEGTLFKVLDFRFMPDFGQNNPQIQDVYVELKYIAAAKLRVGKFKTPIGLEAMRSDQYNTFVERSMASDLVPLREVGAQIGGSVLRNSLTYAAGYFNGTTDGSNGNFAWRPSNEGAMRAFMQPFLTTRLAAVQGLGLGIAGSIAQEHGALPKFKTVGQNTFFKYASSAAADGQHTRITPQAYYYLGPLGILSEYTVSSQDVRIKNALATVSNTAWQVGGSFFVTGEKNSYTAIRPHHAFEPNKGIRYLGAWEIALRYSQLKVDSAAFPSLADPTKNPQRAGEWATGINWHFNRHVKVMNDYEHTSFRMISDSIHPIHSENVIMSRIQLMF